MLTASCADKDTSPTQTAAKVNKEEITVHQINAQLQQRRGLNAQQTEEASHRALEFLIDQELAIQKAAELKVDRDPRVVQAMEAARREIIARAYTERIAEGASRPSPAEIKKYYDDNPALFKERRVYQLHEMVIAAQPQQLDALRSKLSTSKNVGEFAEYLNANKIQFASNPVVRAAEQLPLAMLPVLAKLKPGEGVLNPTPAGAQAIILAATRVQPVDEERASKAIEQFLLNERKRRLIADDLKALRAAATVAYVGKFAASAPTASEPAPAEPMPALPPAEPGASGVRPATPIVELPVPPASGADPSNIAKGLGLK